MLSSTLVVVGLIMGISRSDAFAKIHTYKFTTLRSTTSPEVVTPEDLLLERYDELIKLREEEEYDMQKYSTMNEAKYMQEADVGKGESFWEGTYPKIRKERTAIMQEEGPDMDALVAVNSKWNSMQETGFYRRKFNMAEGEAFHDDDLRMNASPGALVKMAAITASNQLELSKTKAEQLKDMKQRRMMQRNGVMKMIPQKYSRYVDYLTSLRKDPSKRDLTRNILISVVFSFIITNNQRARMAALYAVVGNMMIASILLTRNMPKVDTPMGMDKKRVVNWSKNAFRTAVGISFLAAIPTTLLSAGIMSTFTSLAYIVKARASLSIGVLTSAIATTFFEVFEEKGKNGWRWKRAMEGSLSDDTANALRNQVYNEDGVVKDKYFAAYDPEDEDSIPRHKYVDQASGEDISDETSPEAMSEYYEWMEFRKNARRAPIEEAAPEEPWVGSKVNFYVKKVPTWLNTAYQKNVLNANKWRGKPTRFEKDTSEFDPIEGPMAFRDKRPEWMKIFGDGIWEEKLTASRKAAREFGTYRKTMWKLDPKVVLNKADGAEKGLKKGK